MQRACVPNVSAVNSIRIDLHGSSLFASYSISILIQSVDVLANDFHGTFYIRGPITLATCTINVAGDWYATGVVRVTLWWGRGSLCSVYIATVYRIRVCWSVGTTGLNDHRHE